MARRRAPSGGSELDSSPAVDREQELGSFTYDYLAKIILLGPSGAGKSCLLHRFVKDEWRVLSSQTIGVEFASKIVKVGTGSRRKRIKLQLWDTAGTERFRSVSRSYYRGAAGALLVYDITSHSSFASLSTFLTDARALASPNLAVILVGNKLDLATEGGIEPLIDLDPPTTTTSSGTSNGAAKMPLLQAKDAGALHDPFSEDATAAGVTNQTGAIGGRGVSYPSEGRDVAAEEASRYGATAGIPLAVEVSALSGANVEDVFVRLARMILMKIELGEVDPDDPQSGIQYGDSGSGWGGGAMTPGSDGGSIKSGITLEDASVRMRGRNHKRQSRRNGRGWLGALREWEEVFHADNVVGRRRRAGCC